MIYSLIASIVLLSAIYVCINYNKNNNSLNKVPYVSGSLPLLGHVLQFKRDMIGFIRDCRSKYGDIFKIKIFMVEMIVICNREHQKEFFKEKEDSLSLYSVLDRLYFSDAFSDDTSRFLDNIKLIKSGIAVKFDEFFPKIYSEALTMIDKVKSETKLVDEAIKFVTRTSARCFINIDLDDKLFEDIMEFTHLLNTIVVTTYMFPKKITRLIYNRKLTAIRKRITSKLVDEIEKYRHDKDKSDSLIFRKCVDSDLNLTNQEIGDIIVTLLYVSSKNTALGLTATLTDLYRNPAYLQRLRIELSQKIDNPKEILKSKLLENCVMESARMNIHLFSLNRHPVDKNKMIGNYYVGDADSIVLCGQFIHFDESYEEPHTYNPDRFRDSNTQVMTWGSGIHLCPGKNFAIYEIKMATALFVLNYDMKFRNIPELDYFSPSAFAERCGMIVKTKKRSIRYIKLADDTFLIKNLVSRKTAKAILQNFNQYRKADWDSTKAYPVAYFNNVYTATSNCTIPDELIKLCNDIVPSNWNSMYCNGYTSKSSMEDHYDEKIDDELGISISLGSTCDFTFDNEVIKLEDGDVLISNFTKHLHGVRKVYDDNRYTNFPFNRYSIQMRRVSECLETITEEEFNQMLMNI